MLAGRTQTFTQKSVRPTLGRLASYDSRYDVALELTKMTLDTEALKWTRADEDKRVERLEALYTRFFAFLTGGKKPGETDA